MGVVGKRHALAALPQQKVRYPLYRMLGLSRGRVWTGAEKSRPQRGFESRTSQPVANRYTEIAISVPILVLVKIIQNEKMCENLQHFFPA